MQQLVDQLEDSLKQLAIEHERLLQAMERKLAAISAADMTAMEEALVEENIYFQQICELEKQRQALVGRITEQLNPNARQLLRLSQIIMHVGKPRAGRLQQLQKRLQELVKAVQFKTRVAQKAAEGVLHHVKGVMQSIGQVLASAGTYSRQGRVYGTPSLACSFSITG